MTVWNPVVSGIGTASWVELVWITTCLLGLGYGVAAWRFMRQRRDLMRHRGINGANEIQATMNVRNEVGRVVTSGIYLVVGLGAMLTPPRPDFTARTGAVTVVLAGGLIVAQVYNVWLSVKARRDNYRVLELVVGESARPKRRGKP